MQPRVNNKNWVTLNVGGTLFTTSLSTIRTDPDSLLARMFDESNEFPIDRDEQGNVLIDCDGAYFGPVLNFLRLNEVVIPPNVSNKGVLAAAQFLNVRGVLDYFNRDKRQVIYSWGTGGSGELGTMDRSDVLTPSAVTIVPYNSRVVDVALGANFSCVLTSDGKVYSFGNGDWGQLGLGNPKNFYEKSDEKTPIVTVPTVVSALESRRVVSIATGYAYAMALTENHEVYFWGNNNHGQSGLGTKYFGPAFRKIEEPCLVETLQGRNIVQLGCGSFFVLALSEDGTLYSWGLIDCLGLGSPDDPSRFPPEELVASVSKDRRPVLLTPTKVEMPEENRNRKVIKIGVGQWHSCAVNEAGELYTWGVGFQGRLGHGTKDACSFPTRVVGLEGHRVVDVGCGSFHTVCITDNGTVFCWGDNANGQCGSSTLPEAVPWPHCVSSLGVVGGGAARSLSCGRQHTAVVVNGPHPWCDKYCCQLRHDGKPQADHGQVYVFGESKGMGLGTMQKVCTARLVGGMENCNVGRVVSGLHHMFVIAEIIPPVPYS